MADEQDEIDAARRVAEAKARLLESALSSEPLRLIKDHPWVSLGAAFVTGFGLTRLGSNVTVAAILPLATQLGSLALKSALESRK